MEPRKAQVVELVYAVLSDPGQMERLVAELSAEYEGNIPSRGEDPTLDLDDIERHLIQAGHLFERIWAAERKDVSGEVLKREPFALVDAMGGIVTCSRDATNLLGLKRGDRLADAPLDAGMARPIRAMLRGEATDGNDLLVFPAYVGSDEKVFLGLARLENPDGEAVARLSRIDFGWSDAAGNTMAKAFGLSQSEQDILRSIIHGKSLAEHAAERGRSIETARTQVKSLLAKTGVKSQTQLVRMFAAITLANPVAEPPSGLAGDRNAGGPQFVPVGDGRLMEVSCFGPEDGRPVLFLHNMFLGIETTPALDVALRRHGIRLVAPWRPGFARSTWLPGPFLEAPVRYVDDIERVLDAYGIDRTIAVGFVSGSAFAAAAATHLPDRISGCMAVSGLVPMLSRQQIDRLPNWPRLFAYTARYMPSALSLLIKGSVGLMLAHRLDVLMDGLYQEGGPDREIVADPVTRPVVFRGFERAFEQGTRGYEADAMIASSDWSQRFLAPLRHPMEFIHGKEDFVTPYREVVNVASQVPNLLPVGVEGAGQLVLQQFPDRVVAMFAEKLEASRRAAA